MEAASDGSGSAETVDEFIRVQGDVGGQGEGAVPGDDTPTPGSAEIASGEQAEASGMTGTATDWWSNASKAKDYADPPAWPGWYNYRLWTSQTMGSVDRCVGQ